jgi:amino acid transporter
MTGSPFYLVSSGLNLLFLVDDSVSWVMTDYDATAHITEEMKNPAIKAPVGILTALGVTYVLGFGLNIALAVCMGPSWPDLLATPTGLPAAQLFYNVLGKNGGIAFVSLSAAICNFTAASCLQAQARTLFALSRGYPL